MERPILFTSEMVNAITDGRKTQTRRIVKFNTRLTQQIEHLSFKVVYPAQIKGWVWWSSDAPGLAEFTKQHYETGRLCPYGEPGDKLWVRETWACLNDDDGSPDYYQYKADTGDPYPGQWPIEEAKGNTDAPKWRPSIFMPRAISRITLEIINIRVERLCEINQQDAKAEGASLWKPKIESWLPNGSYRNGFHELWDKLNEKRGFPWSSNPWVWVIEFKQISQS